MLQEHLNSTSYDSVASSLWFFTHGSFKPLQTPLSNNYFFPRLFPFEHKSRGECQNKHVSLEGRGWGVSRSCLPMPSPLHLLLVFPECVGLMNQLDRSTHGEIPLKSLFKYLLTRAWNWNSIDCYFYGHLKRVI